MAREVLYQGLLEIPVLYQDNSKDSIEYFRISQLPSEFTAGKNLFAFKCNPKTFLDNSPLYVEVLDSAGYPIYTEVNINAESDDQYAVVSVFIESTTAPGPGTVILCGIIDSTSNGAPVSTTNSVNIRWNSAIQIYPSKRNTSEIVFGSLPLVSVTSSLQPYINYFYSGNGSRFTSSFHTQLDYLLYNNTAVLTTSSLSIAFRPDNVDGTVYISSSDLSKLVPNTSYDTTILSASISSFINSGSVALTNPLLLKQSNSNTFNEIKSATVNARIVYEQMPYSSSLSDSRYNLVTANFSDLEPISGTVSRIKSYYKQQSVGNYVLFNETDITPFEPSYNYNTSSISLQLPLHALERGDSTDFKFEFINPDGTPSNQVVTAKNYITFAATMSTALTVLSGSGGGGGSATPGGSNTTVQYNNSGVFDGSNSFTYDGSTVRITGSLIVTQSAFTVRGSTSFTGSVNSLNGFTGSLFGTASQAITASYSYTASSAISSSYAFTASSAVSSSWAVLAGSTISASFATTAATASSADTFIIRNQLTASGLNYPTADNGEFSFIQTDGLGNLSLQYVNTLYETIYNGEATTIIKGTPVYVSGSVGANSKVYRADAGNPLKMPVIYIAADNIASADTGRGIALGLITGVDTTGYPAGTEVYVAVGGGWTPTRPTGSAIVQILGIVTKEGSGGQGVVLNPGPANLPNLPSGSFWVGNSGSFPVAVPTSSLSVATASFATSASFATTSLTASFVNPLTQSVFVSGSIITSGSSTFTEVVNSPRLQSLTNVNTYISLAGGGGAFIDFRANNSPIARMSSGGMFIGSDTTPSSRLQVRGSGTTSATTALRVENANASASLVVNDDNNIGIGIITPSASLHVYNPFDGGIYRTAIFEHRFGTNVLSQVARYGIIIKSRDTNDTSLGISNQTYNTMLQGFDYSTTSARGISLNPYGGSVVVGRNLISTVNDLARFVIRGSGSLNTTTTLRVENANASASLLILDDGTTTITGNTIITGSLTVVTGSSIELQVTNTGVKIGNATTDIHPVTGSLTVSGSITGSLFGTASFSTSSSFATSASQAISASYAPVFPFTGSAIISGSLITTGSINISENIVQSTMTQEFIVLPSAIAPMAIVPVVTKTLIGPISMFLEYQIVDTVTGTNQRTGLIMANFNNGGTPTNTHTEMVTGDIGNTSAVTFSTTGPTPYQILANNTSMSPYTFKAILKFY